MKKLLILGATLSLMACAPDKEIVEVVKGDPGVSCTAQEVLGGIEISCENGTFLVSNGQDGVDGQDGLDGKDGENGSAGTLSEVELSGCTSIRDGLHAKAQGSGSLKLYSNSNCSGSGVETLSSTNEVYVFPNGDLLLFQSDLNLLYLLEF